MPPRCDNVWLSSEDVLLRGNGWHWTLTAWWGWTSHKKSELSVSCCSWDFCFKLKQKIQKNFGCDDPMRGENSLLFRKVAVWFGESEINVKLLWFSKFVKLLCAPCRLRKTKPAHVFVHRGSGAFARLVQNIRCMQRLQQHEGPPNQSLRIRKLENLQ